MSKDWKKIAYWLKSILHEEIVKVTFTKKDGTDRVMNCTRKPELVPKVEVTEGKKARTVSEEIIVVYDVDVEGWRSFNINSVKEISFSLSKEQV